MIRDRRFVVISALAVGAAAKLGLSGPAASAAAPSAAPLKARIALDGKSYEFDETKGRDLGDYKGPGFVQRCVMVTIADLPLTVFMRPDRDSDRAEVVFELGRMWSGPPRHLGAYTVEIVRGESTLARIDVPEHFWFSRWRWQSAPRPIVARPRALIAQNLLPPYALAGEQPPRPAPARAPEPAPKAAAPARPAVQAAASPPAAGDRVGLPQGSALMGDLRRGPNGELVVVPPARASAPEQAASTPSAAAAPRPAPVPRPAAAPLMPVAGPSHSYVIMGLAGLEPGMPTTGDRNDIGPMTEPQARWVCTEEGDAFAIMIAQAEASGTFPWNIRDEKTGAPVDFDQYPKVGWFPDAPQMCSPYVPQLKTGMILDTAHHPALCYVPFLATGDPYYLESLQLSTTWCIGDVVAGYRLDNKCILSHGQTRAYAWCVRDVAQLAKATPETVPSWLQPRAYWEKILENNRVWFTETFLHSNEPQFRVFRAAVHVEGSTQVPSPSLAYIPSSSTWMEEYLAFILCWVVMLGFQSWREIAVWKVASSIARTSGKSGWQRAFATPYGIYFKRTAQGPWVETWKELWETNVEIQHWQVNGPDIWSEPSTGYLSYTRAVLALATHLGLSEARECFAWADQVVAGTAPDSVYRWRVRI